MRLCDSADYLQLHRANLKERLGRQKLLELHKRNRLLDALAFPFILTLFFYVAAALNYLHFGLGWMVLFILQGFVIQLFGLYAHEMCTHRRFGGRIYSYFCDIICSTLTFRSATDYRFFHNEHHKYLNTKQDPETRILNSILNAPGSMSAKKIFFSTILGALLIEIPFLRKILDFKRSSTAPETTGTEVTQVDMKPIKGAKSIKDVKRIKMEKGLLFLFTASVLASLIFSSAALYGYLLPVLIITPLASVIRNILEHMDVDANNPIQAATYYHTNFFTRLLFFYDSGDCHLVHHLFSAIPFYRYSAAIEAMEPYFLEQGVRRHDSLCKLIYAFYFQGMPVREPWIHTENVSKVDKVTASKAQG